MMETLYIFCLMFNFCANPKTSSKQNQPFISVIEATQNAYFPGTGIGRGIRYQFILTNNYDAWITVDSIQSKDFRLPIDGQSKTINPGDTLMVQAFGLKVDEDQFPEAQKTPSLGNPNLKNNVLLFFHTEKNKHELLIEEVQEKESEFFE